MKDKITKNFGRISLDLENPDIDTLYDEEITYNVHPEVIIKANSFTIGDLVETAEGHIGLVIGEAEYDRQGFQKYQINIRGKKYLYTSIELKKMENK
tara:strand:+ start:1276 stop:1566 length:291 start_codon:yes stop_codon:yes gene_type:complete